MRLSSRNILPLGLLLLVLSGPLWLPAAARFFSPQLGSENPGREGGRSFLLENLTIYQHEGDRLAMRASLSQAAAGNGREIIRFTDLAADLLSEAGGGKTALISSHGSYDQKARVLSLDGDVRVETGSFTGTTSQLDYFPDKRLVRSSATVHLAGKGISVTGAGFQRDMESGAMQLGSPGGRVICDIR
ncbi:MAG: LPS export ABC transporter periplasmic protein LptC [Thermodesulfobacteriota bacterium]